MSHSSSATMGKNNNNSSKIKKENNNNGKEEEYNSDHSSASESSNKSTNMDAEYNFEESEEEESSSRTKPLAKSKSNNNNTTTIKIKKPTPEELKNNTPNINNNNNTTIPLSKRRALKQGKVDVENKDNGSKNPQTKGDRTNGEVILLNDGIEESPATELELELFEEILTEELLNLTFEIHRKLKTGSFCLNCSSEHLDIVNKDGCDIYGQTHNELTVVESFECSNCSRPVVASRFAPHLEKCMGLGRSSRRSQAKRKVTDKPEKEKERERERERERPATTTPPMSTNFASPPPNNPKSLVVSDDSEQENGPMDTEDWKPDRQKIKIAVRKPQPQQQSQQNTKPQPSRQNVKKRASKLDNYDWADPKVRALLLTTCGVVSNSTGKMCTKTLKCPQHNDDLRNQLRLYVNERVPDEQPVPLCGTGQGVIGNGSYTGGSESAEYTTHDDKKNVGEMSPTPDATQQEQQTYQGDTEQHNQQQQNNNHQHINNNNNKQKHNNFGGGELGNSNNKIYNNKIIYNNNNNNNNNEHESTTSSPFVDILGDDENASDASGIATPPLQEGAPKKKIKLESDHAY